MKAKKIILSFCAILGLCFSVLTITSCNTSSDGKLEYRLLADKSGYSVTGIDELASDYIYIPSSHKGKPIKRIDAKAFSGCSALKTVTIPDTVTEIGRKAFEDCYSLSNLVISNNVEKIGKNAFENCDNITNLTTPTIAIPFLYTSNIEILVLTSGDSIPDGAFDGCTSLIRVTIKNGVTSISDYAFSSCSSLIGITISDSGTSIGKYAFAGCRSLESVRIGDAVTSIGDYAFFGCGSLTSITIPNSVTSIGADVFESCNFSRIVYNGTQQQWNKIKIDYNNEYLFNTHIIYNYKG